MDLATGGASAPGLEPQQSFYVQPVQVPLSLQRKFATSCGQTLRILLRFSWPIALFSAYFLALYGFTRSTATTINAQRGFIASLGQLQAALPVPDFRVMSALTDAACPTTTVQLTTAAVAEPVSGGRWAGSGCDAATLNDSLMRVDAALASLAVLTNAFAYGSPDAGPSSSAIQASGATQAVLLKSACISSGHGEQQPALLHHGEACATFYDGVATSGALAAQTMYAALLREALQVQSAALARAAVTGAPCPVPDLGSPESSRALVADTLVHEILQPALGSLQATFLGALSGAIAYYVVVLAVCTVFAGLVLAATYAGFIGRSVARADADLKRTRATLLLFPADILASVAALLQTSGGGGVGLVPAVIDADGDSEGV